MWLVPVHPQDRLLQGVQWKGRVYVDPMLPFGLRSAPKIFNAIADALEWTLRQQGIRYCEHYLDDFILLGSPDTQECQEALETLDSVCGRLGVPMAAHKREGPTTCLVFLGVEIDTVKGTLRLPKEKLDRLGALLTQWGDKKVCSAKEIQSLVGHLNHACKVVRPGRSFLRRMLDLLQGALKGRRKSTFIRLNAGFRSDLAWWREFVVQWNGVAFLQPTSKLPSVELVSDASGSWGCGAWSGHHWLQVPWDSQSVSLNIALKELIPIILACACWRDRWAGHRVTCRCDNQVVVAAISSRSSRQPHLMHMLRCLAFAEASLNSSVGSVYISTSRNHLADDLSRDRASSFLSKVPQAHPVPARIPEGLMELLCNPQADWISPHWRHQFRHIFRTA